METEYIILLVCSSYLYGMIMGALIGSGSK